MPRQCSDLEIRKVANGYLVRPSRHHPGEMPNPEEMRVFYTIADLATYLQTHFDDHSTCGPQDFRDR